MTSHENEKPGIVSRVLQSERVREALDAGVITAYAVGVVHPLEHGDFPEFPITPPDTLKGHMVNMLVPMALGYTSRFVNGRKISLSANTVAAFSAPAATELLQGVTGKGTFDLKDFVAYGIGTAAFYAVERYKSRHRPPERFL